MRGLAKRRTALLQTAILLILTVAGCGENSSSIEASATDPPTQTGGATTPGAGPAVVVSPALRLEKPKIDVIIDRFRVPTHVKREQDFELTIALKNNSVGAQVAGIANVEIRGSIDYATGAMNIPIGFGMAFRELRPGVIKVQTAQVTAPHITGVWTLRATVKPLNYIDDANNSRDVLLVVD